MDHRASLSAPTRRLRRISLVSLGVLAGAIAAFVVPWSLVASAQSTSWPEPGRSTGTQTARDEADGVLPDGVAVSVFDEAMPAVGKLDPDLLDALRRAATAAEGDGVEFQVNSGWRSPDYQQRLLQDAVVEHGSQEEAARWVATAETSAHVSGDAVDIGPFDAAAWLSEHGAVYGLCQIYGNEPWHYELRLAAVDDGCPPRYADPTEDPRMQP
jgi:D-alanyl-D-alanine carboxypeptidase